MAADAPGFRQALENIIIPAEMMFLYHHCLAKPKESFFISAIAHIQVISRACGLTTKEIIKMRGWVFLKKKSLKGAPYRYQSFSESVYQTLVHGGNDENNPRNLLYRFDDVIQKMRTEYADLTGKFPAPLVVLSRKTSKKRGQEGQPLTKYCRGISIEEKDMLAAHNYSKKIRTYFEKYHLGVCAVHTIFADCVPPEFDLYLLCDSLFRSCVTETGYILTLHDALRVFYGSYSTSVDGAESKNRWVQNPHLFTVQVKLKFGKPGVMSLQRYEEVVASDFDRLMNDTKKKTSRLFTREDNAILIRYRVHCFQLQKRSNSKKTSKANRTKRNLDSSLKQPSKQSNRSINPPATSATPHDSHGFLNLVATQAKRGLPAPSDPTARRMDLLKFATGGRNPDTTKQVIENAASLNSSEELPTVADNIAIESDPGPFQLATHRKLEALAPVLVILPDSGDIDMVLVELSPLDVYYRESLRLDNHAMTYLSSLPSFEEMRRRGYSFQFYSSTKDFVSDSFAILRGTTNEIVGNVMDQVMPVAHSYSAQFKLLGHHGDYQSKRDSGNQAGGVGKGFANPTFWIVTPNGGTGTLVKGPCCFFKCLQLFLGEASIK